MSLPAGTYSPASVSFVDAGNESAAFHCYGKLITAANHDAQQSLFGDLIAALNAICLGAHSRDSYIHTNLVNWSLPTNGAARELALRVQFVDDTTGQKFLAYVPTIDPDIPEYLANVSARDAISLTTPASIVSFITAFEAFAVNPESDAHAITVTGLKVVRGQK